MAQPINTGTLRQAIKNVHDSAQQLKSSFGYNAEKVMEAYAHIVHGMANPHLVRNPLSPAAIATLANPTAAYPKLLITSHHNSPNWH